MRNTLKMMLRTALLVSMCLLPGAVDAAEYRIASALPTAIPVNDAIQRFIARVKQLSDGQIDFKLFEPGALVPPFEVHSAVSGGEVDAGYTATVFLFGRDPTAALFTSIPFGPRDVDYISWFYYGRGLELIDEFYRKNKLNIVSLPIVITGPEAGGWFNKEIRSPADFAGLRARWPGLGGEVLSRLGASINNLPTNEVASALDRGVIDATEFAGPSGDLSLGLWKSAKYYYAPGWHQTSTVLELIINRSLWDKLSDKQRLLIRTIAEQSAFSSLAQFYQIQAVALDTIKSEAPKLTMATFSPETLVALRGKVNEVVREFETSNELFAKVNRDLNAFVARQAIWRDRTKAVFE